MFYELKKVRQIANDYHRRCFADPDFDLTVWYENDYRTFHGFQISYDLAGHPKALTWTQDRGFTHHAIDTGDESPLTNRTPILVPTGNFDAGRILAGFRTVAETLPADIRSFIHIKMNEYESIPSA